MPATYASQYGAVHGVVKDRYGGMIAGANLTIYYGDMKIAGTTISDSDGSYSFDKIPIEDGKSSTIKIKAVLDNSTVHASEYTTWSMTYPLYSATLNVQFYSYPGSDTGVLYGVVSSYSDRIVPQRAVVYLSNGMYTYFEGSDASQWSFTLPVGEYTLWAEQNINLTTYRSKNYTVRVQSDDSGFVLVYLPLKEQAPYHVQPTPQRNIVHGLVTQKNSMPLQDAKVELFTYADQGLVLVDKTTTNSSGLYTFLNVNVGAMSEKYLVRVSGNQGNDVVFQDSAPFDIYFANTIGKKHDYDIPVSMNIVNTGNLKVESTPVGAHVWIDNTDTGKLSPCSVTDLTLGQHEVILVLDGYYNDTSSVEIKPDQTAELSRTLGTSIGSIAISANPSDAAIYLNGQYAGTGSVNLPKKPAGKYSYEIARDGYQNESGTFELIPGKQVNRTFDLVAVPALSLTYIGYLLNTMIGSISGIFQ